MCFVASCAGTNFTSGALFSDAKRDAAAAAEAARLQALKTNEELPLVYLDVAIKGRPIGRIHFVLFTKEAPRAGVQGALVMRLTASNTLWRLPASGIRMDVLNVTHICKSQGGLWRLCPQFLGPPPDIAMQANC